ncbi:hypothetical protein BLNAU_21875 [Blattamonas nauphoetae]|uniref:Uncharacterized protein n=1 Tax=Blattamonas nauphoetae TaxID=2049346 RepID=A0ABQ9WYW2_9EUKA|nr:hypothetical protein BLNAU_21875 [Blattamonas nauphoetae]
MDFQSNHLVFHGLPLPSPADGFHSPRPQMASAPLALNWPQLPSLEIGFHSPRPHTQCTPLPFKRNALPSPSNAMLSPPLQTQCSPLPFKRNAFPSTQTLFHPSSFLLGRKEVTNKAALPLADLVTGVGNIATFADCEKEIALLREYSPKVDILPDLRMLEIEINGFRDIPSSQVEEVNNRTTYFQVKRYDLVDQRVMWPMEESAPIIAENERRTQAGEWSEWETAEIKQITQEKAAAMDNEEDKEEEQSEILAEDDIEGEQSEEEPSPAPTNHRALASRRNTSSPTKHPPQPQTLPQLPISPLSTPVALSPILAFATTPAQHRVINKTMT